MTRKPFAFPFLPIKDWPQLDRLAWEAAGRPAGPLDASGAALRWAATRQITVNAWGRYLGFLQAQGELDQDVGPDERMTFERCGRFIVSMRLSRDQEDVAALLKRLRFAGVRIVTLAEGEIGELRVGHKGTMNALFLKDLADKTRRGLRGRVEAGQSAGGRAFGYASNSISSLTLGWLDLDPLDGSVKVVAGTGFDRRLTLPTVGC